VSIARLFEAVDSRGTGWLKMHFESEKSKLISWFGYQCPYNTMRALAATLR